MRLVRVFLWSLFVVMGGVAAPQDSGAWNDETHLAIARAAGYHKWFNAAGADMAKIKAWKIEAPNHYVSNPRNAVVTVEMIEHQIKKYNRVDRHGHLYGAIVHSVRDYMEQRERGKYGEFHLAFCAHYVGDLSMPLHNIRHSRFNKENHEKMEAEINREGLEGLYGRIRIYPLRIDSEKTLMKEIARIANISTALGYKLQQQDRHITKAEAYEQLSHSASLFKAILTYVHSR